MMRDGMRTVHAPGVCRHTEVARAAARGRFRALCLWRARRPDCSWGNGLMRRMAGNTVTGDQLGCV